ncbi:MAG: MotA/TolQ/ExbB proton channel family protein [Alphaproteobacteria bacterium]|jgi:chemotaxis protein MotA|nr:MotA/TolQ/ExbB proton channel family protein [Alphaproteobacteria bacterium]MBP9876933.1 MotA/TolQ/ExbB proton channel family protein [Alphaproteobacteria bacterium]
MVGMLNTAKQNKSVNQGVDIVKELRASRGHIHFDYMTIFGSIGAVALMSVSMLMGGSLMLFVDIPSFLIVIGGTIAVTMIATHFADFKALPKILKWSLFERKNNPTQIARKMILLAMIAKQKGILTLENYIQEFKDDAFMQRCIVNLTDGTSPKDLEEILKTDLASMAYRHQKGIAIIRQGADVAPAMGLIGTLIGLVQMLGQLSDPSTIGPSMSLALITTFYGAILGSMFLNPLANKLERNSEEEVLIMKLRMIGTISIAKQDNPRRLEMLLNTILPTAKRIKYFD